MDSKHLERLNNAMDTTSSRRQALKLMGGSVAGGLAMAAGLKGAMAQGGPAGSQRGPTGGPGSLVRTFTGMVEGTGEGFAGAYEITRFSNKGGQLTASGNIYDDDSLTTFVDTFTAPVTAINGVDLASGYQEIASIGGRTSDVGVSRAQTCDVLSLSLGPLHLDVLGLVVDLDEVNLDITAESGDGNLLGNLLCAVAGLLDSGSPLEDLLGELTGLLNQILGALG